MISFRKLNNFYSGKKFLPDPKAKEEEFRHLDGFNRIDQLQRTLDHIYKTYVNPEYDGKILLIDDQQPFHRQIEIGFPGFQLVSAFSEEEARKALEEHQVDLILMDLELSEGNFEGIGLTQDFKKRFPKIPIIITSGHHGKQVILKTLRVGADHYLSKRNYDRNEWQEVFTRILAGRSYSAEEILNANTLRNPKAKILVIEDEYEWYQRIISVTAKYEFAWAETPAKALEHLREFTPDLILLDLFFKSGDAYINEGLHFIEELQKLAPNVDIVVITKENHRKMINKVLNKGGHYLAKSQYNSGIWLKTFDTLIELKMARDRAATLTRQNIGK